MSVEEVLSRLDKVKPAGPNRWSCRCPAHDDKSPSLHISVADDGRILMRCFAECDTYSILNAIGLDWDAVFPERAISHHIAPTKKILYQSEALELIRMDAQAVMLSAFLMQKGPLRPAEMETLKLAMDNINKALEISK
jgi:hypothetical protein